MRRRRRTTTHGWTRGKRLQADKSYQESQRLISMTHKMSTTYHAVYASMIVIATLWLSSDLWTIHPVKLFRPPYVRFRIFVRAQNYEISNAPLYAGPDFLWKRERARA
jgi:hypothetical protein